LRYFSSAKVILLLLILEILPSNYCSAAQLKKGASQFISQIQVEEKSKLFKECARYKILSARNILEEKNNLAKVESDNTLTPEQKKHLSQGYKTNIALYEKFITQSPSELDSFFLANSFEYGLTSKASIGCKVLYKQSNILNKNKSKIIDFEAFSSLEVYKNKKLAISLSPKLIFSRNKQISPELRIIFFRSKKKKEYCLFHELQFGAQAERGNHKYLMDVTNGVKFNNGALFLLQGFLRMEPKNPMIIYKSTNKYQISVAKELKNKPITLQASYFIHTSAKFRGPIGRGASAGIWLQI